MSDDFVRRSFLRTTSQTLFEDNPFLTAAIQGFPVRQDDAKLSLATRACWLSLLGSFAVEPASLESHIVCMAQRRLECSLLSAHIIADIAV